MLKIEFTISTVQEASRAARITEAVAREFEADTLETSHRPRDPGQDTETSLRPRDAAAPVPLAPGVASPATPRRGRPPKPDPVAAYQAAGGAMPSDPEPVKSDPLPVASDPEPVKSDQVEPPSAGSDLEPVKSDPPPAPLDPTVPAPETATPAGEPDRQKLLDDARILARKNGMVWLKQVFETYAVATLGACSDDQLREILAGTA